MSDKLGLKFENKIMRLAVDRRRRRGYRLEDIHNQSFRGQGQSGLARAQTLRESRTRGVWTTRWRPWDTVRGKLLRVQQHLRPMITLQLLLSGLCTYCFLCLVRWPSILLLMASAECPSWDRPIRGQIVGEPGSEALRSTCKFIGEFPLDRPARGLRGEQD